ncbi:LVIVD repeat-containing protein [Ferruginibacter sp. SUN106]|uniref:LVIVD repeat-containing protein n=1 Tax=Ferruginibacter sp. SUN106 TaxID=2978348 RepID=UPI003D36A950
MKKFFTTAIALFCLALITILQQGCVKDKCSKTYTYTYFQPLYKTTAEVRANIKSNAPKTVVNPGKIYIKGNYIFLNEVDKGIHIIDNTNPAAPKNIAFIDLPGNVDIAVKNDILYADFYTDLVAMDISNPLNVSVVKFVNSVFPERYYYGYHTDSTKVIYDWVKKTETVDCDCEGGNMIAFGGGGMLFNAMDAGLSQSPKASPVGISGSLARFAVINNYMYTVSNDSLRVINVSTAQNPVVANAINLGWGIETIFPFKDKLFIGSNSGMFIYSVQNPVSPVKQGTFTHVRTCDPVIADDDFAYVTLHAGTRCAGFTNQLDVLNISNIQSPQLIKSYQLTNPRGLSKDGNLLFICDGNDGLKVFNAANPNAVTLITQFVLPEANDVIAFNNIALVIAKDGLYQYDYSNTAAIKLVSKIATQN